MPALSPAEGLDPLLTPLLQTVGGGVPVVPCLRIVGARRLMLTTGIPPAGAGKGEGLQDEEGSCHTEGVLPHPRRLVCRDARFFSHPAASCCGGTAALAGLTQEELAERCGYSANYIGKLERDERLPPPAALECLAATLELEQVDRALLGASRERRAAPGGQVRPPVGRDREVAVIRRFLAESGSPVLLFAGEPGIGKTRLLDEAAAGAAQITRRVVRGGCQRRAVDPYAPISGAVADALARLSARHREDVIRQAGQLELLLPELALSGPAGARDRSSSWSDAAIGPEQRRRLLFAAVNRCLRGRRGPGRSSTGAR